MTQKKHKVIIIGSGPAGLTAAIYAARAELSPLMFAGTTYGGQLMLTSEVGNFPGFPNEIKGPELVNQMLEQAKRYGTEVKNDDVKKVDFSGRPLKVYSGDEEYHADSVIIATGADAKWLEIPSEKQFRGKGVHTCATCDGFFYKGKKAVVVGGGDAAMEDATFLTKFADEVTILVRSDKLKASKIMQRRAEKSDKIKFMYQTEVTEIIGDDKVNAIKIVNNQNNQEETMTIDGVFVAIGHTPNTKFLEGSGVELDEKGYIKVVDRTRTSVDGVFVAGDVRDYIYRQAITAAGEGCRAAMDAEKWLAEHRPEVEQKTPKYNT